MNVQWTAEAQLELIEVWHYIAPDNLDAADRVIERLRDAAEQLTSFPKIGRSGRRARTRELVVAGTSYLLIYRLNRAAIEILRVRHGRQKQWRQR
jgi:toxin ParE1/3/4